MKSSVIVVPALALIKSKHLHLQNADLNAPYGGICQMSLRIYLMCVFHHNVFRITLTFALQYLAIYLQSCHYCEFQPARSQWPSVNRTRFCSSLFTFTITQCTM